MTLRKLISRLRDTSGVAMTEFALGAPFLLMAGLWGAETANYALVNMKMSQLAIHLADNASRVGDTSTLQNRKVYESDINDVIYGAQLQAGSLDIYGRGRVMISSLQVEDGTDNQYIKWQRCRGAMEAGSSYGDEGDGLDGSMDGMGPAGAEVIAQTGDAVIFVELVYNYRPVVSDRFIGNREIRAIASFTVRDKRDLTQIYQRDPDSPDQVQTCSTFRGQAVLSSNGKLT
ncbi:TadE/TadG family type IV pilus assembly protein [Novosphingobium sp.]|uniref:TadE/TadG family type IV pilus assembly protein n=1 Tax=Novosphingobium sp. TaxID=1874826 RepID=UPI002733C460|nr:pilus assembly protein [Novosphingobium sp.]MDP3907501.1 pilus assembly protein [Novosphingobium sp.]